LEDWKRIYKTRREHCDDNCDPLDRFDCKNAQTAVPPCHINDYSDGATDRALWCWFLALERGVAWYRKQESEHAKSGHNMAERAARLGGDALAATRDVLIANLDAAWGTE